MAFFAAAASQIAQTPHNCDGKDASKRNTLNKMTMTLGLLLRDNTMTEHRPRSERGQLAVAGENYGSSLLGAPLLYFPGGGQRPGDRSLSSPAPTAMRAPPS